MINAETRKERQDQIPQKSKAKFLRMNSKQQKRKEKIESLASIKD